MLAPKSVYEELGRNYRFFAGWRHLTFAAGAAIWAGVITIVSDRGFGGGAFRFGCIAGGFGQLILLLIDARSHELIVAAQKQGVVLEGNAVGYFTAVDKKAKWPRHTTTARLFYVFSAGALLYWAAAA